MSNKKKVYYLAVTPDEYELPIFIASNLSEMADIMGIKKKSILQDICHKRDGSRTGYKFIRIIIEDEEELK